MTDKNIKKTEDRKEKVAKLEKKVAQLEDQLKRAVADYRNLEKRMDEEKEEFVKFANKGLLLKLFPAFDTLFIAEKYVEDEGLKLSIKKLSETLNEVGVERVKTVGEIFDPNFMECTETMEGEENKVIEEIRPGFKLFGKVLRPTQVKVGKGTKA